MANSTMSRAKDQALASATIIFNHLEKLIGNCIVDEFYFVLEVAHSGTVTGKVAITIIGHKEARRYIDFVNTYRYTAMLKILKKELRKKYPKLRGL